MAQEGLPFIYMTLSKEELQKNLDKLEAEKKNVLYQLKELQKEADYGDDIDHGEEEAEETEEFVNQLDLQKNLKSRLEDIESALTKIKNGTYGTCEKCGKTIEKEILLVDSESRYCEMCKTTQK